MGCPGRGEINGADYSRGGRRWCAAANRLCRRCWEMAGEELEVKDGAMTVEQFTAKWGQPPEEA